MVQMETTPPSTDVMIVIVSVVLNEECLLPATGPFPQKPGISVGSEAAKVKFAEHISFVFGLTHSTAFASLTHIHTFEVGEEEEHPSWSNMMGEPKFPHEVLLQHGYCIPGVPIMSSAYSTM